MDKEGGYNNIPPLLDGSNYNWWKKYKEGNVSLKPEEDWSEEDDKLALEKSKALNALFNGVDKNVFKLINICTVAKDAWKILRITHECTSNVNMSILQPLISKFENLKMNDDETIQKYHMNILEIANAFSALGEKMSEENLVTKILRSLPRKLDMKVTVIEEAHDISTMKVDEIVGSLRTFASSTKDDLDTEEGLSNTIILLGK
ncbi:uncharacterized protein LOC131605679 [Vicia villosa]|uniref:uncharacterized protein LOC131605679 n=1 Tax=Vicia villosa TaxID=3911 RepID=UPI00273BEAB8|nr:uncharacterized protein LOC131605679 [Vicia villosa]